MIIISTPPIKLIIRIWLALWRAWREVCEHWSHNPLRSLLIRRSLYKFHDYSYKSLILCEFERIWLQVHQDLLYSFLFWADYVILIPNWNGVVLSVFVGYCCSGRKIEKVCLYFYVFCICLVLLDLHDVVNGSFNIEWLGVLLETSVLNLCIAKDVLNIKH